MPDISIFFSYAREDEPLLVELKKYLQPIKRQGLISEWYDNNISAGLEWQQERATQLDSASIIALLISPDFLASDYIYNVEMQRAMQRHTEGTARVIPILLKPSHWENAPFTRLTPLPTSGQPITSWSDRNAAFLDVTRALSTAINDLRDQPSKQQNSLNSVSALDIQNVSENSDDQNATVTKIGTYIYTYDIHSGRVCVVNWSPSGKHIVSGGEGGVAYIWDSKTGHNFVTYRNHTNSIFPAKRVVWDAKWSPDGRFVASCGIGVTVHIWDAQTGKDLILYNHQMMTDFVTETFTLSWSPDGASIASATGGLHDIDQTIHIWNASTGRTQLKYAGHANGYGITSIFQVINIVWSPDGQYIASSGADKTTKRQKRLNFNPLRTFHTVQIWNAHTGQCFATCIGSFDYIWDLCWSPDSKYIATAEQDTTVYVWDIQSGNNVLMYRGHTKVVKGVAWSPDGSRIASASDDHTVHIWHATTGELLYVYREHTGKVATVAWSPDGTRIASAGSDGIVRIWQAV